MYQSPQEESVIRSDEVASSASAERQRPRSARWRGLTVGVASLAAVLGTALVPALGSTPAGAAGNTVTVVTGSSGTSAPSLGVGVPKASAKISPTYVAYNPSNGDTAVASTQAGSVYVYLIAGGTGSEANEYNIQTAPNPSPAFGSLTSGDAYLVAGTGTAGLIAQPGNNQFGNSTTAVATSNPITPTSVAFDPNGNLLIAGENTNASAIQVVAKTTGTFYGVAMTAGDLYTVADVGVSGAPGTAINMGDLAAPANGMSVDPSGNIVVGDGNGLEFVNEQASGSLTLYGQSIPAQSAAVIAGNSQGGSDCAAGATNDLASSQYFQSPEPFIDSSDNVYFSDNEAGPQSGLRLGPPGTVGHPRQHERHRGQRLQARRQRWDHSDDERHGRGPVQRGRHQPDGPRRRRQRRLGRERDGRGHQPRPPGPGREHGHLLRRGYDGGRPLHGRRWSVEPLGHAQWPDVAPQHREREPLLHRRRGLERQPRRVLGCPDRALPRPDVTGVSPASGPTAGGTSVTVSGTNLTGATAVDFGTANPGTSISGVTATASRSPLRRAPAP